MCFFSDHRCFSSALYMAKPNTANTVAPKLARSQNVELLRSACVTCGYIAIVVSLTKISLLGTSAVLQVKAWGGGILCFFAEFSRRNTIFLSNFMQVRLGSYH